MVERKTLARVMGLILILVGFIILLVNAIDYLGGFFGLSSDISLPSSGIGVVFLVVGIYMQMLFAAATREKR